MASQLEYLQGILNSDSGPQYLLICCTNYPIYAVHHSHQHYYDSLHHVTHCPKDIIYPPVTETLTQACSCGLPAETFWQTVSCTCPGCEIITAVPSNTCVPVPCPVVTETAPPDCSPIIGCVTPDCILYSTITIPCGCDGIQTIAECDGNCPTGCETLYTGGHLPCPTTPL